MNKLARAFEWNSASAKPAGGRLVPQQHLYFAFLSYSHKDAEVADWLHNALEKFRVPRTLQGRLTPNGVIPKRLQPIFRDLHELAAGHELGVEIREALACSRALIVLCSPAAATSKWTNAEIDTFKRVHPEGCVIAALVDGEPFASDTPGREAEECLPPALRVKYDRRGRATGKRAEPLAADLREQADGRRLGLLKIVAGILGVGLDDLVQREQMRRQRELLLLSGGSLIGMLITGSLAVAAIQARDNARDQRREAEALVEYMLGDLKDKLEPIGRLDVLDGLGSRVLAYYGHQDPSRLSDEALLQRSKALRLMGNVRESRGDYDGALSFYQAALAGTREAIRRSPNDPQRIFDHAQNVFYIGDVARYRGQKPQAEAAMREYKRLAQRLIAIDPTNPDWQMENIYADTNLGVLLNDEGRFSEAAAIFQNALVDRERLSSGDPSNPKFKKALVEGLAWLGQAREDEGRFADGLAAREREIDVLRPLIAGSAPDADYQRQAATAYQAAGRISGDTGEVAKGLDLLRTSLAISDRLIDAEPANSTIVALGTWTRFKIAHLQFAAAPAAAADMIQAGCDSTDRLVAKDPTVIEWRLSLRAECLELQAQLALATGSTASAGMQADRLVALASEEAARAPSPDAQLALAHGYFMQGLVARAAGDGAAATESFKRAATAWPQSQPEQVSLLARKALILRGSGRADEARALMSRVDAMKYQDPIFVRNRKLVG